MPSARRTLVPVLVVVAGLAAPMVGSGTTAVGAEPPTGQPAAVPAATAPAAPAVAAGEPRGPVADSAEVTLVTGDVVRLDTYADGRQRATVVTRASADSYHIYSAGGDVHVEPASAFGLLAADRLDPELFNVSALVRQGYGDDEVGRLPLILEYRPGQGIAAAPTGGRAPRGSVTGSVLESLHAVAVRERKPQAESFWRDVAASSSPTDLEAPTRLQDGIAKVWLDARVYAGLDQSTAQIGAPAAWQRGLQGDGVTVAVLDSGIDATHPDFDGRIGQTRDFTGSGDVVDRYGHGTHVASIVAGSGAASDGTYRGVAPHAELMVGKVLNEEGVGTASWIIDGMEWASQQDADIVNLSLGGPVSKGDDPMSQALDRLSEQSDTLFVVAAGNASFSEPGTKDVTAPGAAADALTVGAVNDRDFIWSGSRNGLMGDHGLKPDLMAPGFTITAARAAGTGWGDGPYTSMTGTSMAAPHVAGSAALLLQQHPDWTADQVKAALTSTAVPLAEPDVYRVGAGRVDVDRATRQQVYADRGLLFMGYFARPFDATKLTRSEPLTYTNPTDTAVTLDLETTLTDKWGDPMPAGILSVEPATVTIPAGGSATTQVTVDVSDADALQYSGRVVATGDDGLRIDTAVGFSKQDDTVDVTLRALDRNGEPAIARVRVSPYKESDGRYYADNFYFTSSQQEWTLRLPEGDYNVFALIITPDASGRFVEEETIVQDPRLEVGAPNFSLTLDARDAKPVSLQTPRPSTPREVTMTLWRGDPANPISTYDEWYWNFVDGEPQRLSVAGTERVDDAPFALVSGWEAGVPVLETRVVGGPSLAASYQGGPMVDGNQVVRVADGGTGAPDDLADVANQAALVQETGSRSWQEQAQAAADAGAAMVVLYADRPGTFSPQVGASVPVLALTQDEGEALRSRLGDGRPVRLKLTGTPRTPYAYDLTMTESQQIDAPLDYVVTKDDLATIHSRMYTTGTGEHGWRLHAGSYDACECSPPTVGDYVPELGYTRTEYVTARPDVATYAAWQFLVGFPGPILFARDEATYEPGRTVTEEWLKAPLSPGVANPVVTPFGRTMRNERFGDYLIYDLAGLTDAAGNWMPQMAGTQARSRLYRGDELIQSNDWGLRSGVTVPAEAATYRLEADVDHDGSLLGLSTSTHSEWTFHSAGNGEHQLLPLVDVDYPDLRSASTGANALDLTNTSAVGETVALTVTAGHQSGSTAPPVDQVAVSVSYDDGETWTPATMSNTGAEAYTATYRHPDRAGFVSLRVEASDADGNSLDQTLVRAYHLR